MARALIDAHGLQPAFALDDLGRETIEAAKTAYDLLESYRQKANELSVEYKKLPWKSISVVALSDKWQEAVSSW